LLTKYPGVNGLDKALYYIAMSYKALGDPAKSNDYIEKLQSEYPKSTLEKSIKRERQTLQSQRMEPPPVQQDSTRRRDIDLRPQIVMASHEGEAIGAAPEKQQGKQAEKPKDKDKGGLGFIDKSKPIDIVSDTMEGFDKEKMVVFKGSVVAKQDDLYIFTDQIETYMNEESNEISRAYAKGSVKIVKQDRTATAKEAFFDNTKGEIILKGDVNEDKVVVEGEPEKRARAVLSPREKNK
jgi:lipopolysaccharide transport protein LptA